MGYGLEYSNVFAGRFIQCEYVYSIRALLDHLLNECDQFNDDKNEKQGMNTYLCYLFW